MESSDIQRIAQLAKLAFDPATDAHYAQELTRILKLVEQMSAVDTQAVEPMAHPLHLTQRLRPDLCTEADQRERLQQLAPLAHDGLYLVPRVIE